MAQDQSLVDQLPHDKRLNSYLSGQTNNAEGGSRQVCVLIPVFVSLSTVSVYPHNDFAAQLTGQFEID